MRKKCNKQFFLLLVFVIISSCVKHEPMFVLKETIHTGLEFKNNLDEKAAFNILNYVNYYNGGGVAVGDFNNDGLQDIFFTSNLESNKLYQNFGNLKFKDITTKAKVQGASDWSTGVSVADVNGDGWLDIYVCGMGGYGGKNSVNELYINNGSLTNNNEISFTESAKQYGLDVTSYSIQAAFLDYDNDGDLDMYLLNNSFKSSSSFASKEVMLARRDTIIGDKLFRNELNKGEQRFTEVSASSGILNSPIGFGLGITCSDINQDGWIDIYISNDFHENDYLYINQQDGTFSEELSKWISHTSKYSMGNDVADYNNDGLPDIVTMDMLPYDPKVLQKSLAEDHYDLRSIILKNGYHPQLARNCLQLNKGGKFSEIAPLAGIEASDWSWAPLFADLNNDGFKDLYVSNGIYRRPNDLDYLKYTSNNAVKSVIGLKLDNISQKLISTMPQNPIPNMAFKNSGTFSFTNEAQTWGLDKPSHSSGTVYADLDNDGDLELIVNNINENAFLFKNNTVEQLPDSSSYLQIRFKGNNANTMGIGAKAIIKHQGETFYTEHTSTRGFLSSMANETHIGLGVHKTIDSLLVVWPGATYQVLKNVSTNQKLEVSQNEASGNYYTDVSKTLEKETTYFEENLASIAYEHKENTFHDIHREFLIPRKVSTEGPGMAVGDVDGNGLDDIFLTNAKGEVPKMFLQQPNGSFIVANQELFAKETNYEGVDAAFFDADNDNDLDLFIASAGNEYKEGNMLLEDRFYINNGNGIFKKSLGSIPKTYHNASCVKPRDYDNDGDIDIFIGGRVVAGKYGITPKSRLLKNNGHGIFEEVSIPKTLSEVGMVTDAVWTDINSDGWEDLIIVGEWMSITIFLNEKGTLISSSSLKDSTGWWNTIVADDFDNDGDIDLVAGNVGNNTVLKVTKETPVRLYIKDFDNNGSLDPILSHYMEGKEYPFATKDVLNQQLVYLKKQYTSYAAYSGTTIQTLFTPKQLEGSIIKKAVEFQSMYYENKGNGMFESIPLPIEANMAPINNMVVHDVNKDGLKDIILGGNFYDFMPGMGTQDASHGLLLINTGKNRFEAINHRESGILLEGQVRAMDWIELANGLTGLVVAKNNAAAVILNIK